MQSENAVRHQRHATDGGKLDSGDGVFHDDEPAHQEWKRKVLSREIELEDIDTTPYKDRAGVGKGVAISKLAQVGTEAAAAG